MLKLKIYFLLYVIIYGMYFAHGQNLNALKKEADGFFQKQNYIEAKERYLKLIAADQKNIEFNYKYGVCLFETENKLKARKYFEFILNKPNVPVKAHLYRGKIFQHEYDFDNAIREFELCKKDIQLEKEAREEIDRCVSAKEQIKLKSNLTVKEKELTQKGNHEKFYKFSQPYTFYNLDKGEVFEKQNKAAGFNPKYIFKRGMKYRIFASYSEKKETGLDIFIQIKNVNEEWGEIRKIPLINTLKDENYPFYDDSTKTLYFASTGHSSFGGYDIFRVSYDWKSNTVGEIENIGFPYNTPSDDYLYVPDYGLNCAFFTSNRNGELMNVDVFTVSLAPANNQLIASKGRWIDEVENKPATIKINIRNIESNETFGPFISDLTGNISLYFPVRGIYEYTIEFSLYGQEKQFKKIIEIPLISDKELIEQTIRYYMENSTEKVEVNTRVQFENDFDALEPLRLQEISKLSINEKSVGLHSNIEQVAKVDVFTMLNIRENEKQRAIEILVDSLLEKEIDMENNERFRIQANESIQKNNERIEILENEIAQLKNEIPLEEQRFNSQLNQKNNEIEEMLKENLILMNLVERQNQINEIRPNLDDVTLLNEELNEIVQTKSHEEVEKFIESKLSQIRNSLTKQVISPKQINLDLQEENSTKIASVESEIMSYSKQIDSLSKQVVKIESEIKNLSKKKLEEKKEELAKINKQLAITSDLKKETDYQLNILVSERNAFNENQDLVSYISDESLKIKQIGLITATPSYDKGKEQILQQLIDNKVKEPVGIEQSNISDLKKQYEDGLIRLELIKNPEEKYKAKKKLEEDYISELRKSANPNSEEVIELVQLLENRLNETILLLDSIDRNQQVVQINNSTTTNSEENTAKKEEVAQSNTSTNSEENTAKKEEVAQSNTSTNSEENNAKKEEVTQSNTSTNSEEKNAKKEEVSQSNTTTNSEENNAKNEEVAQSNTSTNSEENNAKKEEVTQSNTSTNSEENTAKKEEVAQSNTSTNSEENNAKKEEVTQINTTTNSVENNLKKEEVTQSNTSTNSEENNLKKEEVTQSNTTNNSEENNAKKEEVAQSTNTNSINSKNYNLESTKQFVENQLEKLKTIENAIEKGINTNENEQKTFQALKNRILEKSERTEELNKVSTILGNVGNEQNTESAAMKSVRISQLENEIRQTESAQIKKILQEEKEFLEEELLVFQSELSPEASNYETNFPKDNVENKESESLAKTPEYATYASERIALARSLKSLEVVQNKLGEKIHSLVSGAVLNEIERGMIEDSIKWLQRQLIEIESNNSSLSAKLLAYTNQAQYETMVTRNIQPVINTSSPEKLSSFSLKNKESISFEKPLPIGERKLNGLVFRVQVGAFRKTVPPNLFREFTPVNGEVIPNGLTCYMAGYFNNSNTAIKARNDIRTLGYSDAFIVAYCDGKRIPFEQGQLYEQNKQCIGLSENDLTIQLQNLLKNDLIIESSNNSNSEVSTLTKDEFGVEIAGNTDYLYFSVQVGVFNRSLNPARLNGISDLIIHKAENGQLRYSSGRFDNINEAKNRKNDVNTKGITDAFIVAYFKGKRISFGEAQAMIDRNPEIVKANINSNNNTAATSINQLPGIQSNLDFSVLKPRIVKVKYYYEKELKEEDIWNPIDNSFACNYNSSSQMLTTPLFDKPFSSPEVLVALRSYRLNEYKLNSSKVQFKLSSENSGFLVNHMLRSSYKYEINNDQLVVYPSNTEEKEQLIALKEQMEE